MDHRWDEDVRRVHAVEAERERYGGRRIEDDPDVERRDRLAMQRRSRNRSPWEIGAAHYDQRDLYTRNARIDDAGYGRGPDYHPEEGSYAEVYIRDMSSALPDTPFDNRFESLEQAEQAGSQRRPTVYEREAWPWLNYPEAATFEQDARKDRSTFERVKRRAMGLMDRAGITHRGRGPKNWRPDKVIFEDVCEALTHHEELDARDIEVFVNDGEVTLEGTVTDRRQKRLAEHLADECGGVRDVHNRLRVERDDDTGMSFGMPIRAF